MPPPFREVVPRCGDQRLSYVNATTTQRDSVDPADARARADNRAAVERESRPCGLVDPDGGGCDRARLNRRTDLE